MNIIKKFNYKKVVHELLVTMQLIAIVILTINYYNILSVCNNV